MAVFLAPEQREVSPFCGERTVGNGKGAGENEGRSPEAHPGSLSTASHERPGPGTVSREPDVDSGLKPWLVQKVMANSSSLESKSTSTLIPSLVE